ncbi:MAG: tetratricopeptide repeat protein, partial [Moraxellaceae bacterium]
MADLNLAILIDANRSAPYANRAVLHLMLNCDSLAIADAETALQLDSLCDLSYVVYAMVCLRQNEYEEAIRNFDQAFKLGPQKADTYSNRGIAYLMLKNYDQAFEDFDKAIRMKPSSVSAYNNRGFAKAQLGRYKEAIRDFDVAIRIGRLTDSSHRAALITYFEDWLVVHPSLLTKEIPASPADVQGFAFVGLSVLPNPTYWTFTQAGKSSENVRFSASVMANTASAVKAAVLAGALVFIAA